MCKIHGSANYLGFYDRTQHFRGCWSLHIHCTVMVAVLCWFSFPSNTIKQLSTHILVSTISISAWLAFSKALDIMARLRTFSTIYSKRSNFSLCYLWVHLSSEYSRLLYSLSVCVWKSEHSPFTNTRTAPDINHESQNSCRQLQQTLAHIHKTDFLIPRRHHWHHAGSCWHLPTNHMYISLLAALRDLNSWPALASRHSRAFLCIWRIQSELWIIQ